MDAGARTPEELETLLEDAFVVHDRRQLRALFADGAVLAAAGGDGAARGPEAIALAAAALWGRGVTYVAGAPRVLRARGTALVVSDAALHVACRTSDGTWRFAISVLNVDDATTKEDA